MNRYFGEGGAGWMFAPLLFVGNGNFWIEPQRAQRTQRKRGERKGDRTYVKNPISEKNLASLATDIDIETRFLAIVRKPCF
jgi:hypothetical protein